MTKCDVKKTVFTGGKEKMEVVNATDHIILDDETEEGWRIYTTEGTLTTEKLLRFFANEDNKNVLNFSWRKLPKNLKIISDDPRFCDMTIGEMMGLVEKWDNPNEKELERFFEKAFGLGKGGMRHYLD